MCGSTSGYHRIRAAQGAGDGTATVTLLDLQIDEINFRV